MNFILDLECGVGLLVALNFSVNGDIPLFTKEEPKSNKDNSLQRSNSSTDLTHHLTDTNILTHCDLVLSLRQYNVDVIIP